MIIGEEAKKRMHAKDVLRTVSEMFNYQYAEKNKDDVRVLSDGDKVFYFDTDFKSIVVSNDDLALVESITLAHSIFKVLDFDETTVKTNIDLDNYLSLVDIEHVTTNKIKDHSDYKTTIFNLVYDDKLLAYGGLLNDDMYGMNIDYNVLLSIIELPMILELKKEIDALITYEEDSKEIASYLSLSLRMNDIITEIDYLNKDIPAKFNIALDKENLKDNNVTIIDTVIKEEEIVNINNLIDYFNTHL